MVCLIFAVHPGPMGQSLVDLRILFVVMRGHLLLSA